MKYSVIILTYNRKQWVANAIESVLAQTNKDFELVIIDNGSTDGTDIIVDKYAIMDKRVKVKHLPKNQKGTSIGAGRNAGVQISTGDYITFVDDDDTAEPTMLEFFDSLNNEYNPEIAIYCSMIRTGPGKMEPNQIYDEVLQMGPEEAIYHLFERQKYNAGFWGKCIKRELLLDTPFREDCRYEDIRTSYKVLAKAKKIVAQGAPHYNVIRHESNNSAYTTNAALWTADKFDEYFDVYRERTKWLCERFPDFSDYVKYSEWSFLISMYDKIVTYNLTDCLLQKEYCKKILLNNLNRFSKSKWIKDFELGWIKKYFRNDDR